MDSSNNQVEGDGEKGADPDEEVDDCQDILFKISDQPRKADSENERVQNELDTKKKALQKANCAREHRRLLVLNEQYDILRSLLGMESKVSKVDTLRHAILYIKMLIHVLTTNHEKDPGSGYSVPPQLVYDSQGMGLSDGFLALLPSDAQILPLKDLLRKFPQIKQLLSLLPAAPKSNEESSISPENNSSNEPLARISSMFLSSAERTHNSEGGTGSVQQFTDSYGSAMKDVYKENQPFGEAAGSEHTKLEQAPTLPDASHAFATQDNFPGIVWSDAPTLAEENPLSQSSSTIHLCSGMPGALYEGGPSSVLPVNSSRGVLPSMSSGFWENSKRAKYVYESGIYSNLGDSSFVLEEAPGSKYTELQTISCYPAITHHARTDNFQVTRPLTPDESSNGSTASILHSTNYYSSNYYSSNANGSSQVHATPDIEQPICNEEYPSIKYECNNPYIAAQEVTEPRKRSPRTSAMFALANELITPEILVTLKQKLPQ